MITTYSIEGRSNEGYTSRMRCTEVQPTEPKPVNRELVTGVVLFAVTLLIVIGVTILIQG
jgi:hypothetical protein